MSNDQIHKTTWMQICSSMKLTNEFGKQVLTNLCLGFFQLSLQHFYLSWQLWIRKCIQLQTEHPKNIAVHISTLRALLFYKDFKSYTERLSTPLINAKRLYSSGEMSLYQLTYPYIISIWDGCFKCYTCVWSLLKS